MKKTLLFSVIGLFSSSLLFSQANKAWKIATKKEVITLNKNVLRASFPDEFKLYQLDLTTLTQELKLANDRFAKNAKSTIITLPNANGEFERFEMFEASNFDAALQAKFPNIRAYVGKGIDDKGAILRLSISPEGIQTMVFRTNGLSEFSEPYSNDNKVYAVFNSASRKGKLPFTCSTADQALTNSLAKGEITARSSSVNLLTFRLALSSTSEYSAYFGATSPAQFNLVLAAYNASMTRVNGVFEKDFAIHMNITANSQNVAYYNAATDPYSAAAAGSGGAWNAELQNTLTSTLTDATYDIGHLFGASGGGGNAGCIGCVCVDGQKGSGFTSPGNGIPQGDNFDIDYVAHEMGHQFGANHTFSHTTEDNAVNLEPGSGSTIMGYAGITAYDVQPHSDAYFHIGSILQVENNMLDKTCPTTTAITHGTPEANAGADYTIPKSTPFILNGSGTDAGGGTLTYCWEEFDDATTAAQLTTNSPASATKTGGPNFRSYSPTTNTFRYFPKLSSTIANSPSTNGSDAIKVEALSSVARTLNFVLTVRDNVATAGQTGSDLMTVTVNATAGPFTVSVPNTAVSWVPGTNQNVTWAVAGTTANGVNCAYVDIYLSTDGGNTYPILLASEVPNDGSEVITVPNNLGTTNRIMVKGSNHIFFDISNTNFTIAAAASTFSLAYAGGAGNQNNDVCQGAPTSYTLQYTPLAGFVGTTTFSATGNPAGSTVSFSPQSMTAAGTVTVNVTTSLATPIALSTINVVGTSGATTKNVNLYLNVLNVAFGTQTLTAPADNATGLATTSTLSWPANVAATFYDVQVATDIAFSTIILSTTVTGTTVTVNGLAEGTNYWWRVTPKNNGCSGTNSASYKFTTGTSNCTYNYSNNTLLNIADGAGANAPGTTATKTIVVPGTVTGNLNSLQVGVTASHTYIQDLVIEIQHPDGTIIRLMNRNCDEGASVPAGTLYTFNFTDSATNTLPNGSCLSPLVTGNVKPDQSLGGLAGKIASGTWTLRAADWYNGDTGKITNWSLNLCTAQPLSSENFSAIKDLTIYPNPNNGSFTVNFKPESDKTSVVVNDIRGRVIFNNTYTANGLFNQVIELNNAEAGIYMVTIIDGTRKEVKKIIIQ